MLQGTRGSVVVDALYSKPEDPGFYTYLILPAALSTWVYSVPKRNEYQKQKNNVSEE
jgi:hypothetical protein